MIRLHGRPDLAHDEWLYSAFERTRNARSRVDWLQPVLESGSVRQIIQCGDGAHVEGTDRSLIEMGYRLALRRGRFAVWNRTPAGAARIAEADRAAR